MITKRTPADSAEALRARVRHRAMFGEWKLQAGRLEEACREWHGALDDYPHVQSGRADDRFRVMIAAIKPHLKNPYARELYERARPLAHSA
ncbi:hypothetical protein [Streptomyces sp. NPDC001502]|uniref:hypothetical protein n=1 Tax=Streptomyces sp. NPDC001502 TaxID=3364578 RepID=UPI00369C7674